jgi:hypothetical protein
VLASACALSPCNGKRSLLHCVLEMKAIAGVAADGRQMVNRGIQEAANYKRYGGRCCAAYTRPGISALRVFGDAGRAFMFHSGSHSKACRACGVVTRGCSGDLGPCLLGMLLQPDVSLHQRHACLPVFVHPPAKLVVCAAAASTGTRFRGRCWRTASPASCTCSTSIGMSGEWARVRSGAEREAAAAGDSWLCMRLGERRWLRQAFIVPAALCLTCAGDDWSVSPSICIGRMASVHDCWWFWPRPRGSFCPLCTSVTGEMPVLGAQAHGNVDAAGNIRQGGAAALPHRAVRRLACAAFNAFTRSR